MNRAPDGFGFGVNVAITVLAALAIGSVAYAGTVRALHPVAVALPAASPTPLRVTPPSPKNTAPAPLPTPPRVVPSLTLEDLDLTDASTGWILLSNCAYASAATCQYFVAATQDGAVSWSRPVQVGPSFDRTDGDAPRTVRFLNHQDGFVYGHDNAYVTHDSGKTWSGVGMPANFVDGIATGGQTVWAVTSPCGKGVQCQQEVRRSLDGGRSWLAPHALPLGFYPEVLVPFPSGVMMSNAGLGEIQMTSDGGATWQAMRTQCPGNPFRGYVATSDGKELWYLCTGQPDAISNTAEKTLFVSEDGGKSWSYRASSQSGGVLQPYGYLDWIVSNRSHVAFMSGSPTPLVTHDAGATWTSAALDSAGLWLIRFVGSHDGWALEGTRDIWATSDGGESWNPTGGLPVDVG